MRALLHDHAQRCMAMPCRTLVLTTPTRTVPTIGRLSAANAHTPLASICSGFFYATTARCTTNPPQIESLQEIPNSCKAEVHIKSKACNNSTPSQHVKMSHSLLYDSLSNKSTTSRSSGGCDLFEPCDATGQLLTGQEGREHCTCSERHFTLAASDAAIDGLHQQQILIRLTFAQFLFHLGD